MTYAYDGMNQTLSWEVYPSLRIGKDSGDHIWITEVAMMTDTHQQSMFSAEDSHVRTTAWQGIGADWLETVAHSGGSSLGSLMRDAPHGLSQKTCLGSSVQEAVETSQRSSIPSLNAGMAWSGQCLMLNTSEYRNAAAVCSLSDILEADPDPKYSLSARACLGILNRADKRKRSLPPLLRTALEQVAEQTTTPRKATT